MSINVLTGAEWNEIGRRQNLSRDKYENEKHANTHADQMPVGFQIPFIPISLWLLILLFEIHAADINYVTQE